MSNVDKIALDLLEILQESAGRYSDYFEVESIGERLSFYRYDSTGHCLVGLKRSRGFLFFTINIKRGYASELCVYEHSTEEGGIKITKTISLYSSSELGRMEVRVELLVREFVESFLKEVEKGVRQSKVS